MQMNWIVFYIIYNEKAATIFEIVYARGNSDRV